MSKVVSMNEAIALIKDGDCIATSGIVMEGLPEEILIGIEKSFLETGKPNNLSAIFAAGQGAWDETHGWQHMAHEGLITHVIAGHYGTSKSFGKLVEDNKAAGYNLPQGVIVDLFHEAVKGMPGHITKVGLKTFVDPRIEGGKLNDKAKAAGDIVKVVEVDGEEYLMYKTPKIDVALIRGTTADALGNISFEEEALPVDMRVIAMAAKACGGKVIVQVKYTCDRLMTDQVAIPGIFVDAVVVSENPIENHRQTQLHFYEPSLSGHKFVPTSDVAVLPLNAKKVISRRAAMELTKGAVINLGVGAPEGVANVAAEEGISDMITMTSESGAVAGVPLGGKAFGAVQNAWAIVDQQTQFDFYDGGGLDVTFLGLAEADKIGNVNVSHFGTNVTGCGGFINISQTTKNLVYCGTFTAGGLKETVADGKLTIDQEGRNKKFVKEVQQITFSGEYGIESNQNVLYVTERAVFKLVEGGLQLIEIAPGVDLQKDILDQMDFAPIVKDYKLMDPALFTEGNFGLKDIVLAK
jgi:propionate CoA-transferase